MFIMAMISRIYPEALMHIHTKSSFISHAGKAKALQTRRSAGILLSVLGTIKHSYHSYQTMLEQENCIFMVIEGNSRSDNSQSSNIKK